MTTDYSRRYFQLTPDILVEYNYASEMGSDSKMIMTSNVLNTIIRSNLLDMPFYLINEDDNITNLNSKNFVIQTNKSETRFIKPRHLEGVVAKFSTPPDSKISIDDFRYEEIGDNRYTLDLDTIRFHFTSRNFMGGYEGLIFQLYVYTKKKTQVGLMSFRLSNADGVNITEQPMLINQKYYTTHIDVKIPSVYKLLKSYNEIFHTAYSEGDSLIYSRLKENLGIAYGEYQLMTNSPIVIKLYGIKYEVTKEGQTYYSTENITKITIPNKDRYDSLYVDIKEANDGDYFIIAPKVSDGISFADFMYKVDDELLPYIILHEISVTEHYVNLTNDIKQEKTHSEQYIVNVINTETNRIDSASLNKPIYFRPICQHSNQCFRFTIEDTIRIINTNTNTTIEKKGMLTYNSPAKYGKKMRRLNLSETPPTINVYNKRVDMDIDADTDVIRITNGGSNGPKIETQTQQIVSFVDTTNVLVSIQQVPASDVEWSD